MKKHGGGLSWAPRGTAEMLRGALRFLLVPWRLEVVRQVSVFKCLPHCESHAVARKILGGSAESTLQTVEMFPQLLRWVTIYLTFFSLNVSFSVWLNSLGICDLKLPT